MKKIEDMKVGGKILGEVMDELVKAVKPGVSGLEIEKLANELIEKKGGKASFKMVSGYHFATCISINEGVVHGIPKNRVFKENDVVGIDCGVYYKGYHTDMSESIKVKGQKSKVKIEKGDEVDRFLEVGKRTLNEAIKQAKVGNRIGHISKIIQEAIEGAGYSIVRSLVGHGVGKNLHEFPEIPGYLSKKIEKTPSIKKNMTLAIEVIYNMGKPGITHIKDDDWTIVTSDGSLSGLFERTILVTEKEPIILTGLSI